MPYDIAERVLDCLAAADGPLNLPQLCEKLQISDDQRRPFSSLLSELAAAHRVLQPRPGRYLAVGSGGEIPGVVIAGPGESLLVRTSDDEEVPITRSTLPIRAGDQVVFTRGGTRGNTGALIVQVTARNRRRHVGQLEFTYGFRSLFQMSVVLVLFQYDRTRTILSTPMQLVIVLLLK